MKNRGAKFLFFSTFIFIILLTSLVLAQTPAPGDVIKKAGESSASLFNRIFGVTLTGEPIWELAVTKFLIMLLIFSIVYGISDILILEQGGTSSTKTALKIIFSIVVAYLSVIYLAPAEIYAALAGWGAMAVTITAIIPFAVILALSWKLASNPNPAKMLLQKLLLGIFTVYLIFRVSALIWFRESIPGAWAFALPIYITALVVTVIMLIFSKTIMRFVLTTKVSGYLQISDALNKEEALAEVVMLREKAIALDKVGARAEASRLRSAATNLEQAAKAKFR